MLTSSVSYLIVRFISLRLIDKSPDLITYTRTSACVPPRSGTATPTRPTRALSCRFTAGRSDECRADMGSFGEMLWILHSVGIYAQISANLAVDNHVSGNGRREARERNGIECGCVSNQLSTDIAFLGIIAHMRELIHNANISCLDRQRRKF